MPTNVAPYGSWKSPITSDLIVAQSISLSEVRLDGGTVYWLEGRPQEQGRFVVVRAGRRRRGGLTSRRSRSMCARACTNMAAAPGPWRMASLYFSNFADGRLYRQPAGASVPEPLTPQPPDRAHDMAICRRHHRPTPQPLDRRARGPHGGGMPVNAIVAVDLAHPGKEPGRHRWRAATISFPRHGCRPMDGSSLWLAWDHPNMPWNGTTLYLAELGATTAPRRHSREVIAGGPTRIDLSARMVAGRRQRRLRVRPLGLVEPVPLRSREPGRWRRSRRGRPSSDSRNGYFGMSTYAFAGPDRIVCTYSEAGSVISP